MSETHQHHNYHTFCALSSELRLFKLKYGIVAEIDGPNGKIYLDENGMPVFPPGAMMQNSSKILSD